MDIGKLSLPFLMLGPLAGGAIAAGGAWATSSAQAAETFRRVESQDARIAKIEEQRLAEAIEKQELKSDLKYVVKALERLEDKIGTKK